MRSIVAVLVTCVMVGLACTPAAAQTLYKLIDKNGKVTYSEAPPKDFDGKVIRLDIDPKANTVTLPSGSAISSTGADDRRAADDRARGARNRLDAAQKALADAKQNPGEGEIERVGKKGGGARAQESEGYKERLEKLERDVKEAEDALQKAQKER